MLNGSLPIWGILGPKTINSLHLPFSNLGLWVGGVGLEPKGTFALPTEKHGDTSTVNLLFFLEKNPVNQVSNPCKSMGISEKNTSKKSELATNF